MKTSKLGKILIVALFLMLFTLVLTVATSAATVTVAADGDLSTAISGAAAGDVIELSGGTYTEADPITIDKNLTIQGTGTVNGGAPIFNIAEGVTVTFGGSVKYVGTGIGVSIQGTNTNVTFKDSVCFETTNRVYQDLNNAYTSTVTVQDNVLFKSGSYAIDFDGNATTTGTRAKKTVVVTGATFNCQHGIVFNADYIEASATVTNVTMVNKNTSFYATNNNGITVITVNGGSYTSTSKDKIAMLGGNGSSTTTASFTDVTFTTNAMASNAGALTAEGGSKVTMTLKNATLNFSQTAILLCNGSTLNATLENVTATGRDIVNENGKNGNATITLKGNSAYTCSTGIFSDGTAEGSSIVLNVESGVKITSYALCSDTNLAKLAMAVPSTLNVKGGSVELEMYSARHNNVTVSVTGGTLTVNGIDASVLDNASAVAKIGDTPYDTLEAAIAAAAPGDTITILKNCTISTAITLNKKLTFTGENVIVSQNSVKLTLADGADITVDGNIAWLDFATVSENTGTAKFVINSGYFTNEYADMFNAGEQATLNVTINNGTFVLGNDLCVRHDNVSGGTTNYATNFTINDGTFKIANNTVFRQGDSNVQNDTKFNIYINGGSFTWHTEITDDADTGTNALYFVHIGDWQCQTVVNIKNATFNVPYTGMAKDVYYFFYLQAYKLDATLENCTVTGFDYMMRVNRGNKVSKLTIKSGTYNVGTILAVYGSNPGSSNNSEVIDGTLNISGGTFTVSECIVYLANTGATKSGDAYVTITGGTFNTMKNFAQGGTFMDGWPCTLKVVASNVTINTTGAFFGMSNDTDLKLDVSFTNCTLTSNGRFMSGDIHSITAVFDNTNVTAVERLINLTGASANASTITITGGTFTIKPLANASAHALMFYVNTASGSTTLTINSGTFIADTNGAGEWDGLFILNNGTVNATIKDGTFNSAQIVQFGSAGTLNLTIEKGSFTGTNLFQSLKGGTANITVKGGTFNATRIVDGIKGTTNVTIEGGTFTSTENLINTVYGNTLSLTVKGGTYTAGNYFLHAPTTGADGNPKWSGATVTVNVSGSPEITATNHIFCFYNNAIVNLTVGGGTYTTTEYVVQSNGARMVATWNNGTVSGAKRFMNTLWGENAKFVTDPLGKVTNAAMIVTVNGGDISVTERAFSVTDRGRTLFRINGGNISSSDYLFYCSRSGSNESYLDAEITGGTLTCTKSDGNNGAFFACYKMTAAVTGGTINAEKITVFGGSSNVYFDVVVSGGKINAMNLININGTGHVDVTVSDNADIALTKSVYADSNNDASEQRFNMTGGKVTTPCLMSYTSFCNTTETSITGGTLILNDNDMSPSKFASEAVAKVGETTYNSLAEAIAAAPAGATVTLLKNVMINEFITVDKSLTITGGAEGNRITVFGTKPGYEFYNGAAHSAFSTFILKDGVTLTLEGYVDYYECGVTANHVTATLNLKGDISFTNNGGAVVAYANAEGTPDGSKYTMTVNIYSGTYTSNGNLFVSGDKIEGDKGKTQFKINVYGGTFHAGGTAFVSNDWQAYMYVVIDAGTFTGGTNLVINNASNVYVTLNGGTYSGFTNLINAARCDTELTVPASSTAVVNVKTLLSAASSDNAQNYGNLTANIAGGTYTLSSHIAYVANNAKGDTSKLTLTITGGTFKVSGYAVNQVSGTSTIVIKGNTSITGTTADNGEGIVVKGGTTNITIGSAEGGDNVVFNVKWRLFWFDGVADTDIHTDATLVVYSGTFTSTTNFIYYSEQAGDLDVTVKKATINVGDYGFALYSKNASKTKITVESMTLTALCGFRAFHCSPEILIDYAEITATGSAGNKSECFFIDNSCATANVVVKAGILKTSNGGRMIYGNAKKGTYTFGVKGETDHSKLKVDTTNVQNFAFHAAADVTFNVYSGTYTVQSNALIDVNTDAKGTITLHDGIFTDHSQNHFLIDFSGSGAASPSHMDIVVNGGTYTTGNDFIYYAHANESGGASITINGGTVNFTNTGKGNDTGRHVVYVNGTGTNISYVDVTITGGTFNGAWQLIRLDQAISKVVISGGTATLTSPNGKNEDIAASQAAYDAAVAAGKTGSALPAVLTGNDVNNDAYILYLSGNKCKLLEGSTISGGNYTVTLIDTNTGAIGGNSGGVPANLKITGGTLNCTNGPLFGWYTNWTVTISGGDITCKWLINVNGGSCVENITLKDGANVTCTDCVATDGGAGSRIHIQMDGGELNTAGGWVTGVPFAATFTAQVTGGTYNGAAWVANEQGVVVNGTTYYTDLQTAINEANDGDTLTIVGGITITETININKSLTINGGTAQQPILVFHANYDTSKVNGAYDTFRIAADKSVTFAGYITYAGCGIQVDSGSTEAGTTVTFKDGVVFDNGTRSHVLTNTATAGNVTVNVQDNAHLIGAYAIAFDHNTSKIAGNKYVNVTGGTITANHAVVFNTDSIVGHLYVENGTFVVNNSMAYFTTQSAGNTVVIENADVTSKSQLIYVSNPDGVAGGTVTATINDGTFVTSGTGSLFNSAGCGGSGANINVFTVNIYGGSFTNTSESGSYNMFYATDANGGLKVNIYGGTITAAGAGTHTFARNWADDMVINVYGGKISGFTYFVAGARRTTNVLIDSYKDKDGNVLATPEISATYVFYGKYDYTASGNSAGDNIFMNVTVNAGTITATESVFYTDNSTRVATNTYTVNGGTFNGKNLLNMVSGTTTMTVNGGTFTAGENAFRLVDGSAALTVSGGSYTVTSHFIHQSESFGGTLSITVGAATITAEYGIGLYSKAEGAEVEVEINGMTLTASKTGIRAYNLDELTITVETATITSKGNAYSNAEVFFIDTSVAVATVTVKAGTYKSIGSNYARVFYGLAMDSTYIFGKEGETDNSKLTMEGTGYQVFCFHTKGMYFDLTVYSGTYTVTGNSNIIDINDKVNGEIKIHGGSFSNTTGGNAIDLAGNGSGVSCVDVTVTGGTFNVKGHFLVYSMASGVANISGGTITAGNYGIALGAGPISISPSITDKITVREGVEALPEVIVNLSGSVSITAVNRAISVVSSISTLVNISGGTYTTTASGGILIYRSNDYNNSNIADDVETTDEFSVFNISGGTFNAQCENMFGLGNFAFDKTYTVFNISGGSFNQQKASGNAYFFQNWDWNGNAIISITGGTFTGTAAATTYGFKNAADLMDITISGNTTFTGVDHFVWADRGTTNVTIGKDANGKAPSITATGAVFYNYVSNEWNSATLNATVTDGTFSCAQLLLSQKVKMNAFAHLTVTGGTYTVTGDFITFNNASGIVNLSDITVSGCTNGFVFTGAAPTISSKITDADKVQVSTSPALNEKPDVIVNLSGSFSLTTSGYAFTANQGTSAASDGGISTLVNITGNGVSLTSTQALFHRAGDTQNTWSVYNIAGGTFRTDAEIMLARDLLTKNHFTVMNISGGSFTAGGANLFQQTSAEGDKSYANINISGGSFASTKSDSKVTIFSNGDWQGTMNLNITGGTFTSVDNKVNQFVYNNAQYMNVTFTGTSLSFSLHDSNSALFYHGRVDSNLTIDVNGGSLTCLNGPLFGVCGNVTANIKGGEHTATYLLNENSANAHQVVANIYDGAKVTITNALITDGTAPAATDTTSHVTVNIYGGDITAPHYTTGATMNVRCYVKFHGDCIYNGEAISLGDGLILLNGSEYVTLEAALADAVDGDVLTLTKSFGIVSTIINKSVTITGNDGVAVLAKGGTAFLTVTNNASVTFTGNVTFMQVSIVGEGGTTVTLTGNVAFTNDRGSDPVYQTAGTGLVTLNVQENASLAGFRTISILNGVAADVNITGGTVTGVSGAAIYIANEYVAENDNVIDIYIKDATVTGAFITHSELYASKSKITVEGDAYIYSTDHSFYYNTTGVTVGDVTTPAYHNTEIVINGGTLNIADTSRHIIDMNEGVISKITINGGEFNADKVASAYIIDLAAGCNAEITITGGTVHDAKYLMNFWNSTVDLTITGGTFNTHERFVSTTGGGQMDAVISGCTVNLSDNGNGGHALMFYVNDATVANITINSGVFNNTSTEMDEHNAIFETNSASGNAAVLNVTLNGGTFNTHNFIWAFGGQIVVKANNASINSVNYTVNSVFFVNSDGHKVYGSLASAAALAPAGTTIVIPTNINVGGSTASINKNLTFTGDGVTVNGTAAIFKITGAATLTFEGSVYYKTGSYIVRIDNAETPFEATVHFKGGRFENTKSDGGGETKTIVSDYAPNNTTHLIVEDGVTMICKGWGLHFEGTHAADQNGYKTITMNGGSLTGSHGFVIRAGGVDFKFTVNGGSIEVGNDLFYIENDYYKTDAQENVGEIVIKGGILTAGTNVLLIKDAAHPDINISGGTFHAPDLFEAEGNTVTTMTVTGGEYNVTTFATLANTSAESKLTLTATGATISTTGAFFATKGGAKCVLDCTFTDCELSTAARFISSDAKQMTFNFKDTNLSAVERMFNVTGAGNTADVTVDGGTLTISPASAGGHSLMFYSNSAAPLTVTIKDGTFVNTSTATGSHIAFFDVANNTANSLIVTIEKGTFTGTRLAYAEKGLMDVTIKDGTFNTTEVLYLLAGGNAELDIQGGTFNCGTLVNAPKNSSAAATVTVSGTPVVTAASSVFNIREGNTVTLNVSGGTYTAPYAILVAYGTVTANITGGTFEGLALYTHSALNWAPTIGDGAVINTTHRDYHHATYTDGTNTYCGSIEAVAGAVPAGSTITIVGQLPYGVFNVNKNLTITGTATDSVGDTYGQTQIKLGEGVSITFTGDLSFINATVYANNNTITTFMGNVQFLNGTAYDVFEDENGNYTTTVIIRDNAYLQGNWVIDYEGADTGDGFTGHTGVKTLKMSGGVIDAVYGIVFNVDGVEADIDLTGGKICSTNDSIYLNAGHYNGKRLNILIDGITIESEDLGINTVDSNTLVDITVKSGTIRAGMDGNASHTGDYCIEFYSAPNEKPSTLTILGGTFIADTAHAAIHVTSTDNANTKDVAPIAKIYAGYFEGRTLCAARATTGGWLEIYGGYFAYLPEKYTDSGSPVRSGTGSETGHVEIFAGMFYSTGYGPAINCINDYSYLTVHTQGVQAVGGQYIAPAKPNSTQHRYPDGDHEHEGIISMTDGAGVRLYPNSNGLRFVSVVTAEALEYITNVLGGTNLRFGTLIAPADEVAKAKGFTIELMDAAGAKYVDVPAEDGLVARANGGYYIRAALVNIREENIGREFAATGYVTYDLNGQSYTIYTTYREVRNARSIEQVARLALKDADKYTPAQQAILQQFAPTEAAPVIDFYLVAGQSNAAGSSNWTDTIMKLRPEYYEGFSHILYSGSSNTIHRLNTVTKLGYGSAGDTFGIELGMADALSQYYNEETGRYAVIVKYAYGGTSLYDNITGSDAPEGNWQPPSWIEGITPKSEVLTGGLFRAFVNHIENSINEYEAMGYDVNVVAAYWMQGESDVSRHANDGLYDDIFKCWINDLRSSIVEMTGDEKYNELPILVGEISEYFGNARTDAAYYKKCLDFVKMQREVIGSWDNVYVIPQGNVATADNNVTSIDHSHWGYHDHLWNGQMVGKAIMTLFLGQPHVVEDPVAEIWLNGEMIGAFESFSGAISLAPEGATVKLLKDLELYSTLVIGNRNKITVDGNNHRIDVNSPNTQGYYSAIKFYATDITVKDLHIVNHTDNTYGMYTEIGAKITWIGGSIEAEQHAIVVNSAGSELTIIGGEFKIRKTDLTYGAVVFTKAADVTITINGGTFDAGEGTGYAIYVDTASTNSTVTVTEGTLIAGSTASAVTKNNSSSSTLVLDNDVVIG